MMLLIVAKGLLLFVVAITIDFVASNGESFKEELLVKPLASGHVYSQFKFTIEQQTSESAFKHFRLFPRSFGEIVSKHSVQELHLSLTQGIWRYEKWGYPFRDAPPGAELWAWFQSTTTDVTSAWQNLVNVLSGQFCASLNFIDQTNTVIPQLSFRPEGAVVSDERYNSSYLRYATLPREAVCTENLTPFKKLLPCDTLAGLSILLNAVSLFDAHYLSLAVDFKTICQDESCSSLSMQLVQSVAVVLDPPVHQRDKQDWSFVKLFGSGLTTTCPVSSESLVFVDVSSNKTGIAFHLSPQPTEVLQASEEGGSTFAVYDLKKMFQHETHINVAANYKSTHIYWLIPPPAVHADRYVEGYGQERGGIHCTLYNHQNKPLKIIYLDVIPWFLRVYYHTLQVQGKDGIIEPEFVHYQPAKDRQRPHHLEMIVVLPPMSQVDISIEFEYAFLKWTEYTPDANHGFYVGPAVISTLLNTDRNFTDFPLERLDRFHTTKHFIRLHTQILLVTLPTPDFSMPYNVICLACTVVALAFGPIHNITTKSLQIVNLEEERDSILAKLKAKLKKLFSKQKEISPEVLKKEQ